MKKFFKYVLVVLVLSVPIISFAAEFRAGDQVSIGQDEKIKNDVYLGGGSITSTGMVNGDFVAGGGNIVLNGDVAADVLVGGGNITILSNIGDDVRVGGGTIVIAGKIGGDLFVGGGQVSVSGLGIGGDAVIGGGNVVLEAPVVGDLLVGGGNVFINAPISGNVKIEADKITLGSKAVISGNLFYKATKELVKEDGAIVKGTTDFKLRERRVAPAAAFAAIFSAVLLWKFFALLACALVVGLVFQKWSKEIIVLATKRPVYELGRGLIVLVAIPAISVLLLVTMVGIPFGILGMLGFVIVLIFSWIVAPIILGSVVYQYFSKKEIEVSWKTILLGVFLYMLLCLVPFVGSLARTLLLFVTLGSITALKLKIIKEWR